MSVSLGFSGMILYTIQAYNDWEVRDYSLHVMAEGRKLSHVLHRMFSVDRPGLAREDHRLRRDRARTCSHSGRNSSCCLAEVGISHRKGLECEIHEGRPKRSRRRLVFSSFWHQVRCGWTVRVAHLSSFTIQDHQADILRLASGPDRANPPLPSAFFDSSRLKGQSLLTVSTSASSTSMRYVPT